MNIRDFYGNKTETVEAVAPQPKTQTTITVRDKEVSREMPMGATVVEETVDIFVEEIENGWMKTVNKYCRYMIKEKEEGEETEEEYDSYYTTKRYYSKDSGVKSAA